MGKLIDCPVCKGTGQALKKLPSPTSQKKDAAEIMVKVPCDAPRCDQGKIIE